jgi:hypothetical protein
MFIFVKDQELWICELMSHIMSYDHSLGRKDIIKFVYYFMILFLIYLYTFFTLSIMWSPKECNNVVILNLTIFYLI